jgi:hypothetical protein
MICSVLKCLKLMAPDGQVALQAPHPLQRASLTVITFL